jgi:hypothetical protein
MSENNDQLDQLAISLTAGIKDRGLDSVTVVPNYVIVELCEKVKSLELRNSSLETANNTFAAADKHKVPQPDDLLNPSMFDRNIRVVQGNDEAYKV